MTVYGVTPAGFVRKSVEDILAEIEEELLADVDPTLDLSAETPLGQVCGIMSSKMAELWELLETAYSFPDPDAAEFFLLDAVGALRGNARERPTYSTIVLSCTLTSGTTLVSGTAMANVTGAPTDTWTPVANFTAPTTAVHAVTFRATSTGPRTANAGTVTVITAPISGWSAVTNAADAIPGTDLETDTAYRARQAEEIAAPGSSTVDAVRADVLRVPGVISAYVFENTSDTTDAQGLAPHKMRAVIWDGVGLAASNTAIAQALWDNKPGGIGYQGATSANATDSENNLRSMSFDRATQRPIWVDVLLTTTGDFPADGATQVKEAIVARGASFGLGQDVVALALRAACLTVAGVTDVPTFELGIAALPSGTTNIAIADLEIATFDTSRITVA